MQNATIEYLSESVCVCVCVGVCVCVCASVSVHPCVCVCLDDNSKSNRSRSMKLEYIVLYENISDKFDNGYCQIKVKVTVVFLHLLQYTLLGPLT